MNILFSIIVPTYNRAALISKTIQSILDQTYNNFEVIIVDDGSTDNTEERVKCFLSDRVFYYRKENGERGAARNFGTRKARGNYVNFFDSDDIMYPNHLAVACQLVEKYKQPEVFHVSYEERGADGALINQFNSGTKDVSERLIITNDLACNSVFLRKDVALVFPFEEDRDLATAEDWELWLRLASRYHIYSTNEITYAQIEHGDRSLNTIDVDKVIKRDELLIKIMLSDEQFLKRYPKQIPMFIADRYTFITLNLALTKRRRRQTLKYLWKAFTVHPPVLLRRRFLASIKHLI